VVGEKVEKINRRVSPIQDKDRYRPSGQPHRAGEGFAEAQDEL
jgi:hypothetical protein